ncbi:NAD(P)H-binding protein [Pendulispora rubella]|uniref:NAD(P)H-binding protein n=1 Tax=Pendulispora rubella TaxID=2741070 RepID=A0ABZ2KUI4_9BACT
MNTIHETTGSASSAPSAAAQTTSPTTLIVGGTGKTGRRVAQGLEAKGIPVRIASRSSGAGATKFDWEDESTWAPALRGIDAVYLTYFPDLCDPRAPQHIRAFSKKAVECGVTRIVLLSGRGEPQCWPSEKAVRESGAKFTILRCSWFNQNFSEGQLLDAVRSGEIAFPAGNCAEPFIDVDDIADVAVAALTDDAHSGKLYELTGPRLLTFAEAAAEMSRAAGRPIQYVPVSGEEYAKVLAEFFPPDQVTFLTDLFLFVLDGHNAHLSDGVERALGRKPRDFADFARKAAATGIWS